MSISVKLIKEEVADRYNVQVVDLDSHRRFRQIVIPRHIAMYLAFRLTQKNFSQIGRIFGDRDHRTITHAVNKIEIALEDDLSLRAEIESVTATLALYEEPFEQNRFEHFVEQLTPVIVGICRALELDGWRAPETTKEVAVVDSGQGEVLDAAKEVAEAYALHEQDKFNSNERTSFRRLNKALDNLARVFGIKG